MQIRNLEGLADFEVSWPVDFRRQRPGMTSVLRVKNEARNLPWVLPPLFEAGTDIVLVDNQSEDETADVARKVASDLGVSDRMTVVSYPFDVSRCGSEHLATPAASVHSLAYFYDWSFAHVQTAYSLKWDGDMVLTREGVRTLADLAWQLECVEAVVSIPRHPLYVESDRVAWLDVHTYNAECYVYPMGAEYRHVKGFEWELRRTAPSAVSVTLPQGLCVELKHLDGDEFGHWASPTEFHASARSARKRREWEVFHALLEGRSGDVAGLVRIETRAPYEHVVDYVTEEWLPHSARPVVVPLDQRG